MKILYATVAARLRLFMRREWTREEFEDWYHLDFGDLPTKRILAWAGLCGGTWDEPGKPFEDSFDHWEFEKFLETRGLLTIPDAAAWLSLSVPDYRRVVEAFRKSRGSAVVPDPGPSECFASRLFVWNFHKGFEGTRTLYRCATTAFIDSLHEAIREELGVEIETRYDALSVECQEVATEVGYIRDIITGEPISTAFGVPLATGKPIMLGLDYCSLTTYAAFENLLGGLVVGEIDEAALECARNMV